jgi:hypothetical protein
MTSAQRDEPPKVWRRAAKSAYALATVRRLSGSFFAALARLALLNWSRRAFFRATPYPHYCLGLSLK